MTRLIGPDANSRLVYSVSGARLMAAPNDTATVYSDAGGTVLADIAIYDGTNTPGSAIAGSALTVDSTSQLPLFWFPADGTDTLWVKVAGGPVVRINADYDARLDSFSGINFRGTWAPTTLYAVNDLARLGGELLLCTNTHTSASTFSLSNWSNLTGRSGVYNVMLYGAKGDNSTDDTTAINTALAAAYAGGVADGSYYAELYFPPGSYVLSGATTKGGATQGNAQIPLPVVDTTGRKFALVMRGGEGGEGSAMPHWLQTIEQRSGVVLRSTLTGQTVDGTWGVPSVIGGPTVEVGAGIYTNLKLVVDGIAVMAPSNPSLIGFSLRYLAQATILSASCMANASPAGTPRLAQPANTNGIGLQMPQHGNNDCAVVIDYACEGFYYGLSFGEHFTALRLALIFCSVGIFVNVPNTTSSFHGASIANLSVEATDINIQCGGTDTGTFPIWIGMMSVETTTTRDFDDPHNSLTGQVLWSNTGNNVPTVNGAGNIKILGMNFASKLGAASAPGLPGTTNPLTNPFWRDAVVTVTGGTVTAVSIDGAAQGFTATGFTVVVPSGKAITLTYSSPPTWHWTLL